MAATKRNAMLIDEAREKIKTTQLVNRLQDHALGEIEMSATQVRSVEILLKKRIPDLAAVTLSGDAENPVEVIGKIEWEQVAPKLLAHVPHTED
ncbi:MAG: hypothetical protein EPO02_13770 [Nitrospirae bacterium]|nr:MAG: hypothetical protein EPO02_13770 [Nitrospirota bacterium]